jgi:hypothetical protein
VTSQLIGNCFYCGLPVEGKSGVAGRIAHKNFEQCFMGLNDLLRAKDAKIETLQNELDTCRRDYAKLVCDNLRDDMRRAQVVMVRVAERHGE